MSIPAQRIAGTWPSPLEAILIDRDGGIVTAVPFAGSTLVQYHRMGSCDPVQWEIVPDSPDVTVTRRKLGAVGADLHVVLVGYTLAPIARDAQRRRIPGPRAHIPQLYRAVIPGVLPAVPALEPTVSAQRTLPPATGAQTFADIGPTHPLYAYVEPLARAGIVTGHVEPDGSRWLRPTRATTQGDLVQIVAAALTYTLNPS